MPSSGRLAVHALVERSREVIRSHQSANGAYAASPDFSAYAGYCWFRDGAFIADGMSAVGEVESATAFFDWCAGVLTRFSGTIAEIVHSAEAGSPLPADRMLPARFTLEGNLGEDDWWDFQLDGYGTWIWAVIGHAARHSLSLGRWEEAIRLSVDYLISSWDRPCYDWWEEHELEVHVSTLTCLGAGLDAATGSGVLSAGQERSARDVVRRIRAVIEERGTRDGHLVKWLDGRSVDASLLSAIAPLGFIPAHSDLGRRTIFEVERQLCVDGGTHRYLEDTYFGGGQWPLLSCFLGLAQSSAGDREAARRRLDWVLSTATEDGRLPEQVPGHLLAPEYQREWLDRWGPVATPLLWSHAMFLRLARELDLVPGVADAEQAR